MELSLSAPQKLLQPHQTVEHLSDVSIVSNFGTKPSVLEQEFGKKVRLRNLLDGVIYLGDASPMMISISHLYIKAIPCPEGTTDDSECIGYPFYYKTETRNSSNTPLETIDDLRRSILTKFGVKAGRLIAVTNPEEAAMSAITEDENNAGCEEESLRKTLAVGKVVLKRGHSVGSYGLPPGCSVYFTLPKDYLNNYERGPDQNWVRINSDEVPLISALPQSDILTTKRSLKELQDRDQEDQKTDLRFESARLKQETLDVGDGDGDQDDSGSGSISDQDPRPSDVSLIIDARGTEGKAIEVESRLNETIGSLKRSIADISGISFDNLVLSHKNSKGVVTQLLDDERTVEESGIKGLPIYFGPKGYQ